MYCTVLAAAAKVMRCTVIYTYNGNVTHACACNMYIYTLALGLLGQRHELCVRALEEQLQVSHRGGVAVLDPHEQPDGQRR